MELYLVRHAESENNARPTYQRVEDPAITPVGRMQAEYLADWLKTLNTDALVTSPFRRTLQTASSVLNASNQRLQIWHNVFERGGCFRGYNESNIQGAQGMGRSEILRVLGPHAQRCQLDPSISEQGWWSRPDRESDGEAAKRAREVCERLDSEFSGGQVVVMLIHADLKRLMLTEMLAGSVNVASLGPMRNAGISKVNRVEGGWQLDYFNSVTHLPAKLITGNEH